MNKLMILLGFLVPFIIVTGMGIAVDYFILAQHGRAGWFSFMGGAAGLVVGVVLAQAMDDRVPR